MAAGALNWGLQPPLFCIPAATFRDPALLFEQPAANLLVAVFELSWRRQAVGETARGFGVSGGGWLAGGFGENVGGSGFFVVFVKGSVSFAFGSVFFQHKEHQDDHKMHEGKSNG